MKDEVVKVDAELIRKVEELIEKNKFMFSSKKQVVNLALVEFLKKNGVNIKLKKGGGKS